MYPHKDLLVECLKFNMTYYSMTPKSGNIDPNTLIGLTAFLLFPGPQDLTPQHLNLNTFLRAAVAYGSGYNEVSRTPRIMYLSCIK